MSHTLKRTILIFLLAVVLAAACSKKAEHPLADWPSFCQGEPVLLQDSGKQIGHVAGMLCRACRDCDPNTAVVYFQINGVFEGQSTDLVMQFTDRDLDGAWDWFESDPGIARPSRMDFYQGGKDIYWLAWHNIFDPHYNSKANMVEVKDPEEFGIWELGIGLVPSTDPRLNYVLTELTQLRDDGNVLTALVQEGESLAPEMECVKRIIRVQSKFQDLFGSLEAEQWQKEERRNNAKWPGVEGIVVDSDDRPLAGAVVTIEGVPTVKPVETSAAGIYDILEIPNHKYTQRVKIRISKPGYLPDPHIEEVVLGASHSRIILHKAQ